MRFSTGQKEKWSSEWTTNTPATLAALPRHEELVADEKTVIYWEGSIESVNKLSACRSRLFDYVLICSTLQPFTNLRTNTLGQTGALGKEVKDADPKWI